MSQRRRFAVAREIHQPELDRVDGEGFGDLVDLRLERPQPLRLARPAHVAAGRIVRVDHVLGDAGVGDAVGPAGAGDAHEVPGGLIAGVGTAVEDDADIVGDDGAVPLDAGADGDPRGVARVRRHELLGVVEYHTDGLAHGLREEVAERYVHGRPLAAEVAAERDGVEDDLLGLDAQGVGHLAPRRVGRFARRPHVHHARVVDVHQRVVRLDVRLVDGRRRVRVLDDELGLLETGGDIAVLPLPNDERVGRVVQWLDETLHVQDVGVDQRRVREHRLLGVEYGGELFVVDSDELHAALGGLLVVGDDGCDLLAGVEDLALREHGHVDDAASPSGGRGEVVPGDHGSHAGERERG